MDSETGRHLYTLYFLSQQERSTNETSWLALFEVVHGVDFRSLLCPQVAAL